jgi:hypothetical protein
MTRPATTTQEAMMELPIKFPGETEVILEDVARFRALSPIERVRAIRSLLRAGDRIRQRSPKAEWARQFAEEEKNLERQIIREFIERHRG